VLGTWQITVNAGTTSHLVWTEPALDGCVVALDMASDHNAILTSALRCVTSAGTWDFIDFSLSTPTDALGASAAETAFATLTQAGGAVCAININATLTR
jgi:hypothetical protein